MTSNSFLPGVEGMNVFIGQRTSGNVSWFWPGEYANKTVCLHELGFWLLASWNSPELSIFILYLPNDVYFFIFMLNQENNINLQSPCHPNQGEIAANALELSWGHWFQTLNIADINFGLWFFNRQRALKSYCFCLSYSLDLKLLSGDV